MILSCRLGAWVVVRIETGTREVLFGRRALVAGDLGVSPALRATGSGD